VTTARERIIAITGLPSGSLTTHAAAMPGTSGATVRDRILSWSGLSSGSLVQHLAATGPIPPEPSSGSVALIRRRPKPVEAPAIDVAGLGFGTVAVVAAGLGSVESSGRARTVTGGIVARASGSVDAGGIGSVKADNIRTKAAGFVFLPPEEIQRQFNEYILMRTTMRCLDEIDRHPRRKKTARR
jgi:hypothetical protein